MCQGLYYSFCAGSSQGLFLFLQFPGLGFQKCRVSMLKFRGRVSIFHESLWGLGC